MSGFDIILYCKSDDRREFQIREFVSEEQLEKRFHELSAKLGKRFENFTVVDIEYKEVKL